MAVLYYASDQFACLKLAYQSQRLGRAQRFCMKADRIRERPGDSQAHLPARPKVMHSRTHKRLRDRIIRLELAYWNTFDANLDARSSLL